MVAAVVVVGHEGLDRPRLDPALPGAERLRVFWAAVVAASDLGAIDTVEREFMQLAYEAGFHRDLGRHADDDLRHVIRCAALGRREGDNAIISVHNEGMEIEGTEQVKLFDSYFRAGSAQRDCLRRSTQRSIRLHRL